MININPVFRKVFDFKANVTEAKNNRSLKSMMQLFMHLGDVRVMYLACCIMLRIIINSGYYC